MSDFREVTAWVIGTGVVIYLIVIVTGLVGLAVLDIAGELAGYMRRVKGGGKEQRPQEDRDGGGKAEERLAKDAPRAKRRRTKT